MVKRQKVLPDLSEEQWATWRALLLAHTLMVPEITARLQAQTELIWSEYLVLSALGRAAEQCAADGVPTSGMRPVDLAAMSGQTKTSVRKTINRLQPDFLAERANPLRERSWLVTLTPQGHALLRVCDLEVAQFARQYLVDVVTADDLGATRRVLAAVCAQFDVLVDTGLPAPRRAGQVPLLPFKGETPEETEEEIEDD